MALTDTHRVARPSPNPASRPGPARERADRVVAGRWAQSGLVIAAFASALAGLHVVLQGASWWIVGTGFAAAVLLSAAAARSMLRRAVWPPLISLAVGVMLVTVGYAPDTAILGVIPTPATFDRFDALIESGASSIVEQRAPATPELGIVLLIAMLMVVCAWIAELCLATRHPALIAAPLAVVLAVPLAIKAGLSDGLWFVVTAVLYLAILRIGRRRDSRRATLLVGAVVTIGALLLPFLLPVVDEDTGPVRTGIRTGVNPLITLGDDLRRGEPMPALSYTTSAKDPVYLRLTTLDNFTGTIWGPTVDDVVSGVDLDAFAAPAGLDDGVPRDEATVNVQVSDILSRWLPTPYPTTRIEGVNGEWYWEPRGLTVRSTQASARGQKYSAEFVEVNPTAEQLAVTVPEVGSAGASSLRLPAEIPEIITQTAHEVAGSAGSAYDTALALQNYLRSSPFEYSEDAPVDEGFDGSGLDALAEFLDKKVGYCVHYASAMAVMARELGIPSRIAVGFQPGERQFVEGQSIYTVTSDDMHAWPELYFEGVGWLRFEPTPSRGSVPQYGTQLVDDPNTPEDESSPQPTAAATATPLARPDREQADSADAAAAQETSQATAIALVVLAVVVLLLLVPAGFRMIVRRGRLRRIRLGRDPAAAAWDELRDTARDFGWTAPDSETARAFAARLLPALEGGTDALGALRGSVESSAYGRPASGTISIGELTAVRRAIARTAGWRTRLRVFLLPPSLMHRWRPDDG